MVGLGTLLFLLTLWWWASWIFRRDMPKSRWFLRASAASGVLAVITMEAGWTVSEVGRQPWIVYEKMKVEDAATAQHRDLDHLHRRGDPLRRPRRHHDPGAAPDEPPVPARATAPARPTCPTGRASPRRTTPATRGRAEGATLMATTAAIILFAAITTYAIFGGADFGAGFWDLVAGGTKRGERPREVIDHSIAPVWEANHVWLIFVFVRAVDLLPGGVRLDHPDPLRPADAGRARHRAPRSRASRSARRCSAPGTAATSAPPSRSRRSWCPTASVPWSAASPRDGSRPEARRATRGTAGSTRPPSSRACSPCA